MSEFMDRAKDPHTRLSMGSLFTGYGGLDLAAALVFGARTAWTSDIEPGPCRVIAKRFPDAPNLGDITAVDWTEVPPVDILTGGSPCQDISAAGRRAGMVEGTRSNLWVAMRKGISILKPKLVIWENVRGALSAKADSDMGWTEGLLDSRDPDRIPAKEKDHPLRALGRVLGDLSSLGYDAEWVTLPASAVGAPHKRERVFVLAWRRGAGLAGLARDAAVVVRGASAGRWGRAQLLPTPRASDHAGPGVHGSGGMDLRTAVATHLLPAPKAVDADFGMYSSAIHRWEQVIGRPAPTPTVLSQKGRPRLNSAFVEWMMGLPAGWVTDPSLGLSRVQQLRLLGNGVVPQQAEYALRAMLNRMAEGDDCGALGVETEGGES